MNKLTTMDIDDVYRHLLRAGGPHGRPLAPGTVHPRAYVEGPTGPVLRATKSHRTCRVAIDEATIRRLVEHRGRAEARAVANRVVATHAGFVFSGEPDGSRPWLPNGVTKTFITHLRRSDVGRFRLHDLRHFTDTQMLTHGVAVVTVSQRLSIGGCLKSTSNARATRVPATSSSISCQPGQGASCCDQRVPPTRRRSGGRRPRWR